LFAGIHENRSSCLIDRNAGPEAQPDWQAREGVPSLQSDDWLTLPCHGIGMPRQGSDCRPNGGRGGNLVCEREIAAAITLLENRPTASLLR